MAELDLTSFDAALKEHYDDARIMNLVYANNPLLAMIAKKENFGGRNWPLPIITGVPQGRSATFATASANKTPGTYKSFLLTRAKDYSLFDIDGETIDASEGDANAFMEAAVVEVDGAVRSLTRSLAGALYGSGSGSIGVVASGEGTTTITLATIEDIVNFEVGMEIVASTVDGGGAVQAGTQTVTAVDRDLGTVTGSAVWTTAIATIAATDFLFVEGDYDSKVSGLLGWLPTAAPGATAFFGVDRTEDVTRLGGVRYDGSGDPIDEALLNAAMRLGREGGEPDVCYMSHNKYKDLINALGGDRRYVKVDVPAPQATIGFEGVRVAGPSGPITVIPDHNCPDSQAFMLTMRTWALYSLGKAPKLLSRDGLTVQRNSGSDSVEGRWGYYAQLGCRAPGWNANITLP